MAHFAEVDDSGIVLRILVVPDDQEFRGATYLSQDLHLGGTWIQTSYNGNVRKRFAGIGYRFDAALDAFISPQPYPSLRLDSDSCDWIPPVRYPDAGFWVWDEQQLQWIESD